MICYICLDTSSFHPLIKPCNCEGYVHKKCMVEQIQNSQLCPYCRQPLILKSRRKINYHLIYRDIGFIIRKICKFLLAFFFLGRTPIHANLVWPILLGIFISFVRNSMLLKMFQFFTIVDLQNIGEFFEIDWLLDVSTEINTIGTGALMALYIHIYGTILIYLNYGIIEKWGIRTTLIGLIFALCSRFIALCMLSLKFIFKRYTIQEMTI